jgi:hypothetical protein
MNEKENAFTKTVRKHNRQTISNGDVLASVGVNSPGGQTGNSDRAFLGNTRRDTAAGIEARTKASAEKEDRKLEEYLHRFEWRRRIVRGKPVLGFPSYLLFFDGKATGTVCQLGSHSKPLPIIDTRLVEQHLSVIRSRTSKKPEAAFRNRVALALACQGWNVTTEYRTATGRIDILAHKEGQTLIVEVKCESGVNSMAHALGQLLFYKLEWSNAVLCVATPNRPKIAIIKMLESYGVNWLEEGR